MDREATQQYGNAFYAACPGLRHTIDEIIGDGEVVAVRLTARGSHTRPFGPIEPLNRTFELPFINWSRFDHAKVIERCAADSGG